MPRLTFPAKAKVFAIWVRRRRGATLLARVIILSFARISQKRCCDSLDFRENPTFAAFPAALCSVFSLRRYVTALLFLNRRIHSFRVCLSAYWGQKQKASFLLLQIIVSAHENLGELSPAIFRDWRATPPFKRFRVFCGVFSLFAPSFRAHILFTGANSPSSRKP